MRTVQVKIEKGKEGMRQGEEVARKEGRMEGGTEGERDEGRR